MIEESADDPPVERQFRLALRSAPSFYSHRTPSLRYTWVHDPLGPSQGTALLGKTDLDLCDAESAESAKQIMQFKRETLGSGSAAHQEFIVNRGGRRRVVDLSVEPICDASGQIVGLSGAEIDVTERGESREAMSASTRN